MQTPLDPTLPMHAESGMENKAVQSAIKIAQDFRDTKNKRDSKNDKLNDLFEKGFEVSSVTGTKKIHSKMLQQAIWRMASRMKPLDFILHGTGRPEDIEAIVANGVGTVMKEGGYISSLRDKAGAFYKLLMYGDSFVHVGASDKKGDFPIQFNVLDNSNVYVNKQAVGMRQGGQGREATRCLVVFPFSFTEVRNMFPDMKDKIGPGRLPTEYKWKDTQADDFQTEENLSDLTEVGYYYDIDNMNYTIMVGSRATVVKELKGDDYPFFKDEEPYIPVLQWICYPGAEGFYNHGIGDMIYDLAVVSSRLLNMGIGQVEDNTYPITLLNVPQGEAGKFFNKMRAAHEMRAAGKKAVVPIEYDPTSPNSSAVSSQSLLTQSLLGEWQMLFSKLDQELRRLGINLDEIDRGRDLTATQILAEEESANAFIKQIMEYNASETGFAVELTMDFIAKFIRPSNKTELNMTTTIRGPRGPVEVEGITLGDVAEELKKNHYFPVVNSRSGVIPSGIFEQAQITRILQVTPPGTPAYTRMVTQLAKLNGRDFNEEDFGVQAPTQSPVSIEAAEPTETDRVEINVQEGEREAAI